MEVLLEHERKHGGVKISEKVMELAAANEERVSELMECCLGIEEMLI